MNKVSVKILIAIGVVVLFLVGILGYLFFSSPSQYSVDTSIKKELVVLQGGVTSNVPGASARNGGFCAPPGCGPGNSIPRENITLSLTDEQVTALINGVEPKSLPVSNIKIKFDAEKIIIAGTSRYALFPGTITAVSRLDLNHFYVEKVYIGGIQAPSSIANFIEANGDGLLREAFLDNDIFLKSMRLEENNLIFEASVPKGMIEVKNDIITITRPVVLPATPLALPGVGY